MPRYTLDFNDEADWKRIKAAYFKWKGKNADKNLNDFLRELILTAVRELRV